jgi:hypothetical protein
MENQFPKLPPEIANNPGSILLWAMTPDGQEYFQKLNEALVPPSGGHNPASIMEIKMTPEDKPNPSHE